MNDRIVFFPSDLESISNIQHIERSFCTNFSCCNTALPDLHALYAHFDSEHLPGLVHNRLSTTLSPLQTTTHDDPGSSPSSSSSSSVPSTPDSSSVAPNPAQPPQYEPYQNGTDDLSFASEYEYFYPDFSYTLSEYSTHEQCYNAAISAPTSPPSSPSNSSPASSAFRSTAPTPAPGALFASLDNFQHCLSSSPSSNFRPSPADPAMCSTPLTGSSPSPSSSTNPPPPPTPPTASRARSIAPYPKPAAAGISTGHYKRSRDYNNNKSLRISGKANGPSKGAGRKKERLYACPTPGCSKMYLNPNGLKYHQEKGTCKFESVTTGAGVNDAVSGPDDSQDPAPPTQNTSISSTPSSASASPLPSSLPPSSSERPQPCPPASVSHTHIAEPGQYTALLQALQYHYVPHHQAAHSSLQRPRGVERQQPHQPVAPPAAQLQAHIHQPQPRQYAQVAGATERLELGVQEW